MKIKTSLIITLILQITILILIDNVKTDAVCDLQTLKLELLQDLEDNDMLDCLREIKPPHNFEENEEQTNKRLAAQWDTSCSFEADSVWFDNLKKNYGITQLVDSEGDAVKVDFDDQADMCELIRAAVSKNLFSIQNLNMRKLPHNFVDRILCAGPKGEKYGPQICAATSGSFYNGASWNVFNKSSAITFDNKPQFTDKDPEVTNNNPFRDDANAPESVNDLSLLSKDQLDNAGGDLATAINNAIMGKGPQGLNAKDKSKDGLNGDVNKESSKNVHHYFKRIESCPISSEREFRLINGGDLRFVSQKNQILVGAFMASYKLNDYGEFCMKMTLNDIEVQESRSCMSGVRNSSITSAFAQKYDGSQTKLSILSKSTSPGSIESDGETSNLSFGSITFPNSGVYEYKLTLDSLNFPSTNRLFKNLENFHVSIKHKSKKPAIYLIFLNFGVKLPQGSIAGSLITVNNLELIDTTVTRGQAASVSLNSVTAVELFQDTEVSMKYMYQGSKNIEISAEQNDKYNQSITAFKLPRGSKLQVFKPTSPVSLSSNNWMSFNINARTELSKETHILIIYHCHIKIDKKAFSLRLKMNGNHSFKSTLSRVEEEEFASIQGYMIKKFKAGNYEFDLEFLTNSRETYNPASEQINKQTVSIKIIQFP